VSPSLSSVFDDFCSRCSSNRCGFCWERHQKRDLGSSRVLVGNVKSTPELCCPHRTNDERPEKVQSQKGKERPPPRCAAPPACTGVGLSAIVHGVVCSLVKCTHSTPTAILRGWPKVPERKGNKQTLVVSLFRLLASCQHDCSEMSSSPRPPRPQRAAPFSLPIVTVTASSLEVLVTEPAKEVLGVRPAYSATKMLGLEADQGEAGRRSAKECVREQLEELSRRSRELRWGESVVLEYYRRNSTGEQEKERAEVLVASSSSPSAGEGENDTVYSILFLRPDNTPQSPATSPRSVFAFPSSRPSMDISSSLFSQLPSPSFTSNSPPISSPPAFEAPPLPPPSRPQPDHRSPGIEQMLSNGSNPFQLPPDTSHPHSAALSPGSTDTLPLASPPPINLPDAAAPPSPTPSDFPFPQQRSDAVLPDSHPVRPSLSAASSNAVDSVEGDALTTIVGEDGVERRVSFDSHYAALMKRINMSASQQTFRMPVDEAEAREIRTSPTGEIEFDIPLTREVGEMLVGKRRERRGSEAFGVVAALAGEGDGDAPLEKVTEGPEPRLPLSFQMLMDLVESVPQILFIADRDGKVVWLNSSWYKLTGGDERYLIDEQVSFASFAVPTLRPLTLSYPTVLDQRLPSARPGRRVRSVLVRRRAGKSVRLPVQDSRCAGRLSLLLLPRRTAQDGGRRSRLLLRYHHRYRESCRGKSPLLLCRNRRRLTLFSNRLNATKPSSVSVRKQYWRAATSYCSPLARAEKSLSAKEDDPHSFATMSALSVANSARSSRTPSSFKLSRTFSPRRSALSRSKRKRTLRAATASSIGTECVFLSLIFLSPCINFFLPTFPPP
jgi:PAS domain-containing protein